MPDTTLRWSSPSFLFRIICTTQALAQVVSYAFVTIYSMTVAPIDFLLPVRIGFGITVLSSLMFPINDFNRLRVNPRRDWAEMGFDVYRLPFELIAVIALLYVASIFIPHSYSSVNLTSQSGEAKAIISIGVASLAVFTIFAVEDLRNLMRRGDVPSVIGPSPPSSPPPTSSPNPNTNGGAT